jgi:hypothetical protein
MLELWVMPQLLQDKPNIFQHVGASSHFHSEVTTFLNRQWLELWIGRRGFTSWSPRSPDLTPLDFFSVGLCKRRGLRSANVCNLEQIEGLITNSDCRNLSALLQNVRHEVEYRHDVCRATNGAHTDLAHSIKKSSCSLQWCVFDFCAS